MLLQLLRKLPPAGDESLESLVGNLMSAIFRMRARPEGPGYQAGRDIALFDLETDNPTGIEIEVKRYDKRNQPPERMLVGEAEQAVLRRPNVRLWILVSTVGIYAARAELVKKVFEKSGVEFKLVDPGNEGPGSLETMVARHADVVLTWVRKYHSKDAERWAAAIKEVEDHPLYGFQRDSFEAFIHGRMSPHSARVAAQAWLGARLDATAKPVRGLNQAIGRKNLAPPIRRERIEVAFRSWLDRDGEAPRLLVLLGDEGDGKTWSALDGLRSATDRTPLVATANMFDDGGADSLLAKALSAQCGGDEDEWRDQLLTKPKSWFADFNILLLLDGLNEAPASLAIDIIGDLFDARWGDGVQVVVTCRKPFWDARIGPLLVLHDINIQIETVGPFAPVAEWPQARALLGPGIEAFSSALINGLHNPRLWSFAYDLRDSFGGLEEVTLERLLIEHWRLRTQQRVRSELSPERFKRLIAKSVEGVGPGLRANRLFEEHDLKTFLGQMGVSQDNMSAVLGEISDGVFFASTAQEKLKLRPERVLLALGLLTAQQIADALELEDRPSRKTARDIAGQFLHGLPAKDELEVILRSAILAFLSQPTYRAFAMPALLRQWVGLQNTSEDFQTALGVVAGACPDDLVQAIEDEADEDEYVTEVADKLLGALIGRRDRSLVHTSLRAAAARWLGSYRAELYGDLDADGREGLRPSTAPSIESLYDHAAQILARLKPEDWAGPLSSWSRRQAAVAGSATRARTMDMALRWLGMSDGFSDQDAATVWEAVQRNAIPLQAEELRLLGELLDGGVFQSRHQESRATVAAWPGADGGGGELSYAKAYPTVVAMADSGWTALEPDVLSLGQDELFSVIQTFLGEVEDTLSQGEPAGSLAQFINDNALVLGEAASTLARAHLHNRAQAGGSIQPFGPGGARPAIFIGLQPADHADALLALADVAPEDAEIVAPQGLAPVFDEAVVATLGQALKETPARRGASLELLRHWPADRALPKSIQSGLLDMVFGADALEQARSLEILGRHGDEEAARRVALSGLTACDGRGLSGPDDLSDLILRGTAQPTYLAMRQRVSLQRLTQAALADGSAEALEALSQDFGALLAHLTGVSATPPWPSSPDFRQLPLVRADRKEDSAAVNASWGAVEMSPEQTGELLALLERTDPSTRPRLLRWLVRRTDSSLIVLEGKIGLLTALAGQGVSEIAAIWRRHLPSFNDLHWEVDGLRLPRSYRMAFSSTGAQGKALRDRLAQEAWTDGALCDLVCAAQIYGGQDWLEGWVRKEQRSGVRARRVRAILLRGWRGSPEDIAVLQGETWATGYEAHAVGVARTRAQTRTTMARLMETYRDTSDVTQALWCYRQLLQILDRRFPLVARDLAWPDGLDRQRRAYHEVNIAELEWRARRNEGGLDHAFANIRPPSGIAPWGGVVA